MADDSALAPVLRALTSDSQSFSYETLRARYPDIPDVSFRMWFWRARKVLEAEGIFVQPLGNGRYGVAGPAYVVHEALHRSRRKIKRAIRRRTETLAGAQRNQEISPSARDRVSREEELHSRFATQALRDLRRKSEKKPPGC